MHSEALLEHFRNPRHVGSVAEPDAAVEVINPACGDWMQLSVRIREGLIEEALYQTRGCTASIACGSALTQWLTGRNLRSLADLSSARISAMVGGLEPASLHAAALCMDAISALVRILHRDPGQII